MALILDVAGLALLALFLVAVPSDVLDLWPCAVCGFRVDHPVHFRCAARGLRCRWAHHAYRKAAWPYAALAALMGAVLVALLVPR
jgi:hypothetical protein